VVRRLRAAGAIVLGKKSGKASIEHALKEAGLTVAADKVDELVAQVKKLGAQKKGLVTKDEFARLAAAVTR
jgi:methanogen homocitrate synthase